MAKTSDSAPGGLEPHVLRPLSDADVGDEVIWALVDAAPDGLVLADEAGRILLVNRRTEELFGYDRGELLGLPVEQLLPERFRGLHLAHRTRFRAEPKTRPMGAGLTLLGRRRDGSEFPVEVSLSPLHTPDGAARVIAAVRDITERVEAEARERETRALLDATRDAVFILDRETLRYTYANEGAADQLGYTRDELLAMGPLWVNPELDEATLRRLFDTIEEGGSRTYTTVHRRRDGRDVPVEIIAQAPRGITNRLVMVVRDITERVEAEDRIREAEQELRTAEERERIARELHDTVIQRLFAAGLGLQGAAARATEAALATRIQSAVGEIDEAIRELRGAIFELQAPAAARAGLRERVLRLASEEASALGFDPRVSFTGPVDATSATIGDEILAVVREALSNVVKHANALHATVAIEADPRTIVVRVVDDGVGIHDRRAGGLGVSNMTTRAEKLGGECTIVAPPDGGTVVEWRVPNR